ncbi:MAG: multiubiquitin domain-containing protein [Phycisphaerales bacterium]|nr:multiubiquitin domain-containing protein [Phycisphaerales bacterium]
MHAEKERAEGCGCEVDDDRDNRRFCVNTEGTEHAWPHPTITTEEIARLGGWDPAQGVVEVHEDNTERTLQPGEVVHLRPGRAFCRRVRWKRGLSRADRITAEIELLRRVFPSLEFKQSWVRIPGVALPSGWNRTETNVAFAISDTFPGAPPSGLFVPAGLRFNGNMPQSYTEPAPTQLPFPGTWGSFSWTIADAGDWRPSVSVEAGVNLLQWVRGFSQRFAEGA